MLVAGFAAAMACGFGTAQAARPTDSLGANDSGIHVSGAASALAQVEPSDPQGPAIWTMNADGSELTALTDNEAWNGGPKWSPDGTKIAFTRQRYHSGGQIYVMNADSSDQVNLSQEGIWDGVSDWSPDGTKILFESYAAPSNLQVFVMSAEGSGG